MVKEGWKIDCNVAADKVKELVCRLENCRDFLLRWSKMDFPNARRTIDQLTKKLEVCRKGKLTEIKRREVEEIIMNIEEAWDREEMFWW